MTSKSKKRKSLVISNPIPCNTAFPADHVSIHSSTDDAKEAVPTSPNQRTQSISEETSQPEESGGSSKGVNSSDSDLSSAGTNTPKRQSVCDERSNSTGSQSPEEAEAEAAAAAEAEEAELATNHSDDSGVGVQKSEAASQEVSNPSDSADSDVPPSPEQENVSDPPSEAAKPKAPPVPAPRVSFRSTDKRPLLNAKEKEEEEEEEEEEREEASANQETGDSEDDSCSDNPPGFLYKVD